MEKPMMPQDTAKMMKGQKEEKPEEKKGKPAKGEKCPTCGQMMKE